MVLAWSGRDAQKSPNDLCVKGEEEAGGEKCIVNGERRKQWAEVRENYPG